MKIPAWLALMRLLSTLVTGHRLLDQKLADRQIEEGKTLGDFSFFNVKEALHSRVDVDDICTRQRGES
jgi:hypothetical protein